MHALPGRLVGVIPALDASESTTPGRHPNRTGGTVGTLITLVYVAIGGLVLFLFLKLTDR